MILGLISDTHGLLRDGALRAMHGADLIVHAGDVGSPDILDALEKIAPLVAVRGNVDMDDWAAHLPVTAETTADNAKIYVLHDLNDLKRDPAALKISIVVSGHSHKPEQTLRDAVLYINPGSAGPRRFHLPITVARLDLRCTPWNVEFIDVSQS
ncbi:MAG: metallophosphatase family protein [Acidobacteriota bacterium]|nr:metallophosphatase family protein [Acidobacteriota bacterium]